MSNWFVVAMGLGTVFVGLICIVFITKIMSFCCKGAAKKEEKPAPAMKAAVPAPAAEIANKQEFVAAVSAAIAEYSGKDMEGLRIISIKRI